MKKMISLLTALCLMLTLLAGGVSAFAEDAGAYTVLVTDSNGDPVQGAVVQFCSDTECMMVKTDETGIASFEQGPGSYTVHILKVPEGFVPDDTEYTAPETGPDDARPPHGGRGDGRRDRCPGSAGNRLPL